MSGQQPQPVPQQQVPQYATAPPGHSPYGMQQQQQQQQQQVVAGQQGTRVLTASAKAHLKMFQVRIEQDLRRKLPPGFHLSASVFKKIFSLIAQARAAKIRPSTGMCIEEITTHAARLLVNLGQQEGDYFFNLFQEIIPNRPRSKISSVLENFLLACHPRAVVTAYFKSQRSTASTASAAAQTPTKRRPTSAAGKRGGSSSSSANVAGKAAASPPTKKAKKATSVAGSKKGGKKQGKKTAAGDGHESEKKKKPKKATAKKASKGSGDAASSTNTPSASRKASATKLVQKSSSKQKPGKVSQDKIENLTPLQISEIDEEEEAARQMAATQHLQDTNTTDVESMFFDASVFEDCVEQTLTHMFGEAARCERRVLGILSHATEDFLRTMMGRLSSRARRSVRIKSDAPLKARHFLGHALDDATLSIPTPKQTSGHNRRSNETQAEQQCKDDLTAPTSLQQAEASSGEFSETEEDASRAKARTRGNETAESSDMSTGDDGEDSDESENDVDGGSVELVRENRISYQDIFRYLQHHTHFRRSRWLDRNGLLASSLSSHS